MRSNLANLNLEVFLNYPYDEEFELLAQAMHFTVVAAGLIPVCAKDLSAPDRSRLEMLVETITNCHYSIHDFSRSKGEGSDNFARFNMPIEMGMALFHALGTQRNRHRCAFFVAAPHDYLIFASDLAGLDPKRYDKNDELSLITSVYDWLRSLDHPLSRSLPTVEVKKKYKLFRKELEKVEGSGKDERPSHGETQELMYRICSECKWWAWRENVPVLPLSWKEASIFSFTCDVIPDVGL